MNHRDLYRLRRHAMDGERGIALSGEPRISHSVSSVVFSVRLSLGEVAEQRSCIFIYPAVTSTSLVTGSSISLRASIFRKLHLFCAKIPLNKYVFLEHQIPD